MIKLTKQFSRERSLMYAYLWYRSDTTSSAKWFGIEWKNTLYMREAGSSKISIWYDESEVTALLSNIEKKLNTTPKIFDEMIAFLDQEWTIIFPYLTGKQKITDISTLEFFYEHSVQWWYSMNIMYFVPNMKNVPEEIKRICLQKRKETELYSDRSDDLVMDFIKSNSQVLKDFACVLTPEEVSAHFGGQKIDMATVKRRIGEGCALLNGALYDLNTLDQALQAQELILERGFTNEQDILKGNIAFMGLVKGPVRIVLTREQLKQIKKGDVLVAEMTSPDYVPYLDKVVAIVTDEGGITCHAAIVSRELKKPCVIGTKHATKVLKDGDIVEVDANTGIIKKLL